MLRIIDDFLFITTDLAKAKRFLVRMRRGHSEYGCHIAPEKTVVNFPMDAERNDAPQQCHSTGRSHGDQHCATVTHCNPAQISHTAAHS